MAGYVKDDEHAISSDVCRYVYRNDKLTITVFCATDAGMQTVSLVFSNKAKCDSFWAALLTALP